MRKGKYESEQGEHASEGTSENDQFAKGKIFANQEIQKFVKWKVPKRHLTTQNGVAKAKTDSRQNGVVRAKTDPRQQGVGRATTDPRQNVL